MLNHKRKVILLLALACLLCVALSGCIVDPETSGQPEATGAWLRYTQIPATDVPTEVPAETPTPDPNTQSWDETEAPQLDATPTPTIGAATIVPGLVSTETPTIVPGTTESTLLKRGMQGDRVKTPPWPSWAPPRRPPPRPSPPPRPNPRPRPGPLFA